MTAPASKGPPLADLVLAGVNQTAAELVTDFVFMARDVSNAYLVTTSDGDVLINAGTVTGAPRTRALFAPVRSGPLRHIVLTQSHPDHFGGAALLREPGTTIFAERRYAETRRYYLDLQPFFAPQTGRLWSTILARQGGSIHGPEEVAPDFCVDESLTLRCGERTFELISTPGGETLDSLTVWMPQEKIAFTGNLFGPVFLGMPFLNTLRGDKPRSVGRFLASLDKVRALGAEVLVTGHGEPIIGAARIREDLDRLYAAVSYIDNATKAGMNSGKDLYTLMREVRLPEEIAIGEWHGKVSWAVKAIWHEYSGWFLYESTTELYGIPRSSVSADLVELAGGPQALAHRARAKLEQGYPLEAIHLLDIALDAVPADRECLSAMRDTLKVLLDQSGETNLSETMWLKSEIARTGALLNLPEAGADSSH